MCKDEMKRDFCCCIQGPQGMPGLQGEQGIQGVPGAQGIMGTQGLQGVQGLQGPAGICTPEQCQGGGSAGVLPYANLYANTDQIVQPYNVPGVSDAVLLDSQNAVSALDFDLTMKNINGEIKFLKHGIYKLTWVLQARIATPVPVPVPSWSFGLWLNGVLVPGSIYSGFTQAPGDDACHSSGELIVEVKANDLLRLRNTSISIVNLNPNVIGSVFPITIASININCLKLLP